MKQSEIDRLVHCHESDADVCEDNDVLGWFFWDETGGCNGPWGLYADAVKALKTYCEEELR